jgi:hypothetical protein
MNFTEALKEITVANGYAHDLATSAFRGRVIFGENDPVPMVSILRGSDPAGSSGASDR